MKFKEFNLREEHIFALKDMYINEPTEIQRRVIPPMKKGRDLMVQAQTGTGKTLAFLLPILEKLSDESVLPSALIIVPTRELSNQITEVLSYFKKYRDIGVTNACGGHNINTQVKTLSGRTNIVVGTPGRLLDLLRRGAVNFKELNTVVVDEVDQIISFGFLEDLMLLFDKLPSKKQVCMFSATISEEVKKLAKTFLNNVYSIQTREEDVILDHIRQVVIQTTEQRRTASLLHMMEVLNPFMCVIFCNSKKSAEDLYQRFIDEKCEHFDLLHGDLSQSKRESVLRKFREMKTQYLITTDLAARGIDIEGITHVFNYQIPRDVEYYIHRIGRTGRMNREGYAISFVTEKEEAILKKIERTISMSIPVLMDKSEKQRERMKHPFPSV